MGLRDSLSDVSSDLGKILKQLKDIETTQKNISKGATAYAKAVGTVAGAGAGQGGGGRASNGTPQATFSTPPPPPGSALGGVTAASGGHSTQTAGSPGTSSSPGWARAAALTGAAAVTYGYNVTPGVEDVFAAQRLKFRASFLSPGGYNANYYQQSRSLFGQMQTDPFGMMTAANIATMTGNGMGTANFGRVMRETATTSAIFGMDNASSMMAQAGMNSGSFAGRMAKYGIFVSDMNTGTGKGLGALVDQIWAKHYGSSTRKIPYESVAASIRGGWLGLFLNKNFGDVPELREQVTQALLMKAKENGDRLDFSDLGPYGAGATNMPGARGTRSAMGVAVANGLTPENDPGLVNNVLQGSRGDVMDASADNILEGYRFSAYSAANINRLVADVTASGNALVDFLLNLKGALQGFSSIGELSPILGFLTGGPMGAIKSLFAGGGHVAATLGSSTSDSIPARLSKGEYVINARAAQTIGVDNLNAMNALGHQLGSAYPSPAKGFAGGGQVGPSEPGYTKPTITGTVPDDRGGTVTAGEATLDRWSALLSGDPALKSYPISGSTLSLTMLGRDGIGQYLADFAAAWQAHPALGKGRLNLSKSGASGAHQARTTGHGGVSNHAAGVAMDLRWDVLRAHDGDIYDPTGAETSAIRALLKRFDKLEWGGDWVGPGNEGMLDEMHFEIRDPRTWGKGGHSPSGADVPQGDPVTEERDKTMRSSPAAGVVALVGNKPQTSGFGSYSGGAAGLGLIAGAFAWHATPHAKSTLVGPSGPMGSPSEDASTSKKDKPSPGGNHPDPGSGSGEKWLYNFLASKGLRGDKLKTAWTISMRESGGRPSLVAAGSAGSWTYPDVPGWINWTSSGSPHYDTGLFQINNVHLSKVQAAFGAKAGMNELVDPNKNYQIASQISANWSNLLAWGMNPDGSFNWSSYPDSWVAKYGAATEARTAQYFNKYDSINVHGYSEGAYRTHEGMAKLHEGEMVLPATVAEQFREAMRSAATPGGGAQKNVSITLHIDRASDEEAEKFARKVKQILDEDEWSKSVRRA